MESAVTKTATFYFLFLEGEIECMEDTLETREGSGLKQTGRKRDA